MIKNFLFFSFFCYSSLLFAQTNHPIKTERWSYQPCHSILNSTKKCDIWILKTFYVLPKEFYPWGICLDKKK